ncbi:plancitoxin-1-like [Centropristis striata]|uniref:plancitoxin-1-like n=1 Tax=Centropristis striata TaxID=184440 RepID=UPI0027DEBB6A|nr:plancitoxin-1-like [Centropristis striata]
MTFLLSVGVFFQVCDSDVRCRDDKGKKVDWYILYKLPNTNGRGLSYLYMDKSTNGWQMSNKMINSESGTLANTLKPLLDFYNTKTEGFGYMLYNDQPPKPYAAPASFGHSKGVVMLDRKTGVWLSHSTPKFPTYRSRDFWPDNGNANAQTFMCVTYFYDQFKEIGEQLKYIHAYSYDSDIPTTFHNELRCVAQRECYPKKEPWFRVQNLTSMNGRGFVSFAKYTRFGDDLYSGLIVYYLKRNLYVKSWGKMRSPLPSNCSSIIRYQVYNVKKVELPNVMPFSDTVDHSKWVVTDVHWTCIADMNREESQMKRGGGAICTDNDAVRKAFIVLINEIEQCKDEHVHSDVEHRDSTPKFPTYCSRDFWPNSGNANAQTFMCMTYSYHQFKEIGGLKLITFLTCYESYLRAAHNELQCVAQRECYPKKDPWFRVQQLTSMNGRGFLSFAKYTRFGDDLYSGLIVYCLEQNLYVKSWCSKLPANCSDIIPHDVYNVKKVELPNVMPFSDTVDHSKWLVTSDGGWTCIADTNRATTQMKRGGGAICTYNDAVRKAFYDLIAEPEKCNRKNVGQTPRADFIRPRAGKAGRDKRKNNGRYKDRYKMLMCP